MCVISNVMDHYGPLFPQNWPREVTNPETQRWTLNLPPTIDRAKLEKLIAEFKEAVAAAQRLDVLMKQPDCVDPDKAKLIARVAELEAQLAKIREAATP